MNTVLHKKWVAWVVLILMVLNISTLATIIFITYKSKPAPPPQESFNPKIRPGYEMIQELGLDSSQAEAFHNIRSEFFKDIKPSLELLQTKRKAIVEEINNNNPDTLYLYSVADSMGSIQAGLKKETMRHFLRIKKICNAEQREKLSGLYAGMFLMDEPGKGPGMGMRYRHGRNQVSDTNERNYPGRRGGWRNQSDTLKDSD
ncbi:MAG: Spy/CpxP family protein refolding chaperone [Bacteroidales bacterium]